MKCCSAWSQDREGSKEAHREKNRPLIKDEANHGCDVRQNTTGGQDT